MQLPTKEPKKSNHVLWAEGKAKVKPFHPRLSLNAVHRQGSHFSTEAGLFLHGLESARKAAESCFKVALFSLTSGLAFW